MKQETADIVIRPAIETDIPGIVEIVNGYAAQNLMLPRTDEQIRRVLKWFLVGERDGVVLGCGSLVELTPELTELRSLAVAPGTRGTGLGRRIVEALVLRARESGYKKLCALTLQEGFFNRLGFATVERWTISPKIWRECIYCPKFNACDEIAVLMNLTEETEVASPEFNMALWARLKFAHRVS